MHCRLMSKIFQPILSYNIETLLAEKIQTILSRGTANTRMRVFYDVYMLTTHQMYSKETLSDAFIATCIKRKTIFSNEEIKVQTGIISNDELLIDRWKKYLKKNSYTVSVPWSAIMDVLRQITYYLPN